jgi:hypothetical protein
MACACKGKRQQFEVVANGGTGKVLFTSGLEPTAKAVAKRYENSIVRPKEATATAKQG